MRILCLYLRYGREHSSAFERLRRWQFLNLSQERVETWIIDNSLPEGTPEGVEGPFRLFSGDNSMREFSGWDRIRAAYAEEIQGFDLVHFVDDRFDVLYTKYLEHFHPTMLARVASRPVCLGHIDSYDREVSLKGVRSQHWIRTCFFFMSPSTLDRLGPLVSQRDEADFFDREGLFRRGSLSGQYVRYITDWLAGVPLQGVSWHSRIGDPALFRKKALMILNEHALSIRLRQRGVRLMDFCWSWYRGSHGLLPSKALPGWREQVRFRSDFLKGRVPDGGVPS